jgi:hypothetical protein
MRETAPQSVPYSPELNWQLDGEVVGQKVRDAWLWGLAYVTCSGTHYTLLMKGSIRPMSAVFGLTRSAQVVLGGLARAEGLGLA